MDMPMLDKRWLRIVKHHDKALFRVAVLVVMLCITSTQSRRKLCHVNVPCAGKEVEAIVEPAELSIDAMRAELIKQGVHHVDIVLAQACLETGWFTSTVCKTKNNCFGLRYDGGYMSFDAWQESVAAYRDKVQYKYDSQQNYYAFLDELGYAEDAEYIDKVKAIVKQLNSKNL